MEERLRRFLSGRRRRLRVRHCKEDGEESFSGASEIGSHVAFHAFQAELSHQRPVQFL